MRKVRTLLAAGGSCLIFLGIARAQELSDWKVDPIFKTHTIAAAADLSGPGQNVPGLPMTYDMSLFEWNWGGRQSTFNGSGITTNSNFPLAEGEAITTNTDMGVEVTAPSGLIAGIQGEAYGLAGNRTVGRVFGEELPWDNFDRAGGNLAPSRSNLDLDRGWLRYAGGPWSTQVTGGTLPAQTLPEFTRKTMNYLKLGSLVWRPPITNASFFEKRDRKLEEGRHPVRGGDLITDYEYASKKHIHLELFSGQTKPTPIADIDRLSWGGRMAADILTGNLGVTFIRADGDKPRAERQDQWALDASHPIVSWLSLYGALARSSYTRGSANFDGTAAVGGLAFKGPRKTEAKVQYQWLGENYDLIGTHKTEHYPTNFRGIQGETTVPVGKGAFRGTVYHLRQMETNTRTGDTLFGDSYFPALANSKPGTITTWRMEGETGPWHRTRLRGYLEQAHFRKDALADANDIDKRVINLAVGPSIALTPQFSIDVSLRHLIAAGRWQTMRFHHRQEIPEFGLTYARGKNLRASLIYHRYEFVDSNPASSGGNNYRGNQILAEVLWRF
ncbi:MAG: hypothetical protein HY594_04815 [Candidatus Omnitrophica bacterium]|nr:hypothetical protein [Candidatus Omnitrophota bacterium]